MASKLIRNFNQSQRLKFVGLVVGCFLISLTFILMSRPQSVPLPSVTQLKPADGEQKPVTKGDVEKISDSSQVDSSADSAVEYIEEEVTLDDALPTGAERKAPLCDVSDPRVDVCDVNGDVRIAGKSSAVVLMEAAARARPESWTVEPYPRKGDDICSSRVRAVTVKSSHKALRCTVHHDVPAIFFSTGGYAGNLFHDFTDLLIPLFLTAGEYDGNVKFVVSDFNSDWINKYLPVLEKLSKHPVINHDDDKHVHCFKNVVVGLRSHKELGIEPWRAPHGYSMADFAKFVRTAYSLQREATTDVENLLGMRPKLMVIARRRSLAFTNVYEIVQVADNLGFDVRVEEVDEAGVDVARLAQMVNSCDVLMGVHGSGLTNLVFLPPNATVIQVVPWGGLEDMAKSKFGEPAKELKLNYMQYSISVEESSLKDRYPRDHPALKDPLQIHKQGWGALSSTFMAKQDVRLDVNNFKDVLWKALEHVMH